MVNSQCTGEKFEEKYTLYSNMLYRICMAYLKHPANVEDAMQDSFICLLYKAPKFKALEDEQRWLVRIAINICKDYLKRHWNKRTVSIEEAYEVSDIQETNEMFHLIRKLPEKYKTVMLLHYTEGFTIDEISKICLIGVSAIKMRLKRGRELLKKEMEE